MKTNPSNYLRLCAAIVLLSQLQAEQLSAKYNTQPPTSSEHPEPLIPGNITAVETHQCDQSVIRVIAYNPEVKSDAALVAIERFTVPGLKLAEQVLVTELRVDGDLLKFDACSYASLKSIKLKDSTLKLIVEFIPLRASGSRWILCTMELNDNQLRELKCQYINMNTSTSDSRSTSKPNTSNARLQIINESER